MFEKLKETGKGDILFGKIYNAELRLRNATGSGTYMAITDQVRLVTAAIRLRDALRFGPDICVNRFAPIFDQRAIPTPGQELPLYV